MSRLRLSSAHMRMDFRNSLILSRPVIRMERPNLWSTPSRGRSLLGVRLWKRMKQISYGKQRETKRRTQEVEIVTNAMLRAPMHPRNQMKCFEEMRTHDHDQTSCAAAAVGTSQSPFSKEQHYRSNKQDACRHQPDHCLR
jgi:hypothetical protein